MNRTVLLARFDAGQTFHQRWDIRPFPMFERPLYLRFFEAPSGHGYSVYHDRDDEEVYLAHGTGNVLVPLDEIDLDDFLSHYRSRGVRSRGNLMSLLVEHLLEPDEAQELHFCEHCEGLVHVDEIASVGNNDTVCETCLNEHYHRCYECEEHERNGQWIAWVDDWVCSSCVDDDFTWCDLCDEYVRDTALGEHNAESHDDDGDCDCEAPAQVFSVPNVDVTLVNDEPTKVTLAAGIISEVGMRTIADEIREHGNRLYYAADYDQQTSTEGEWRDLWLLAQRVRDGSLDPKWQTKEGNFTKRLSKLAYKELGFKVTPDLMTQVGNIGSEHSRGVDFDIEVTRNLNLPREEFAHDGSCWWTEYSESRCALKSNGGFGLRTFTTRSFQYQGHDEPTVTRSVEGRAWVMPMRDTGRTLTPTFDAIGADAFIVFNGYGDLENYAPARIVAHMAGMSYCKVGFVCSPMYVNNEAGYLVAGQDLIEQYGDQEFRFALDQHANLHTHELNTATMKEMSNA